MGPDPSSNPPPTGGFFVANTMMGFLYRNSGMLLAAWIVLIFILCAAPGHYFPSAGWMELLSLDKWIHAALFFILNTFSWMLLLKRRENKNRIYLYTFLALSYGVALELMQAHMGTQRAYDELDMLANAIGTCLLLPFRSRIERAVNPNLC